MTFTRRDQTVVVLLLVLFVALGGALAMPRAAAPQATPPPTLPVPTQPPPVVYREGVVGSVESVTPLTARTRAERTLAGLVFSGLVRLGPNDTYEPDLAEWWTTSADGKTWDFRIREDATWHDGAPVTAEDVVFTIEALRNPESAGGAAGAWGGVVAQAIDERTVRFTLETPLAGFLAAATQPLLPAHLLAGTPFADLATSAFAHSPVGTGPFALASIDQAGAVLTRAASPSGDGAGLPSAEPTEASSAPGSPTPPIDALATPMPPTTPWSPVPYLDRIELTFLPDEAAAANAIRAGQVDAVSGLSPETLADLADLDGLEETRYPTTTLSSVLLNQRAGHRELRDERARRALLAAIDRDAIVAGPMGGIGTRANALVPPTSAVFDAASAVPVPFDAEQAAKLLDAAGWKRSKGKWLAPGAKKPYRVELLSVPADANPRLAASAAAVRDAWTRFGLEVDLVELPAAKLAARLRDGEYTAAVLDIGMGQEPDLYPLLASSQVRSAGGNLSWYQDAELDKLLEAARAPATPTGRAAAWKALLAALAERQPILPLAWNDEVLLSRGLAGHTSRRISDPGDRFWDVLAWRLAADR